VVAPLFSVLSARRVDTIGFRDTTDTVEVLIGRYLAEKLTVEHLIEVLQYYYCVYIAVFSYQTHLKKFDYVILAFKYSYGTVSSVKRVLCVVKEPFTCLILLRNCLSVVWTLSLVLRVN